MSLLLIPVIFIMAFGVVFDPSSEGDLVRMGSIPSYALNGSTTYKNELEILFHSILNDTLQDDYDILVIGDSFANQQGTSHGFKNYLAEDYSVLYTDRSILENQVSLLHSLINSNFFSEHRPKYVVLEIVERNIKSVSNTLITDSIYDLKKRQLSDSKPNSISNLLLFKAPRIFKNSIVRILDTKGVYQEKVYSEPLLLSKFSGSKSELLFYSNDLNSSNISGNDLKKFNSQIQNLNSELKKQNIELILFIAPDKFNFYYEHLKDKDEFENPMVFEKFDQLDKQYLYFNTLQYLKQFDTLEDIYMYDNTHWSPKGDSLIARKLKSIIELNSLLQSTSP